MWRQSETTHLLGEVERDVGKVAVGRVGVLEGPVLEMRCLASELGGDAAGQEAVDKLDGGLVRVEPVRCKKQEVGTETTNSHNERVSAAVVTTLEGELAQ